MSGSHERAHCALGLETWPEELAGLESYLCEIELNAPTGPLPLLFAFIPSS